MTSYEKSSLSMKRDTVSNPSVLCYASQSQSQSREMVYSFSQISLFSSLAIHELSILLSLVLINLVALILLLIIIA